jgi:hypothetical protein
MLGLQDEIVILVRLQQLHDRFSNDVIVKTVLDQFAQIRLPLPEVVIDVEDRNPGLFRARFEFCEAPGHWQRMFQELLSFRELEVIDDVDQQ